MARGGYPVTIEDVKRDGGSICAVHGESLDRLFRPPGWRRGAFTLGGYCRFYRWRRLPRKLKLKLLGRRR